MSIDIKNNQCRNDICNRIRTALSTKSNTIFPPSIDKGCQIPLEEPLYNFKKEFESAGGTLRIFEIDKGRMSDQSYVVQRLSDIYGYVKYTIEVGQWTRVLNVSPHLSKILKSFNVDFVESLPDGQSADALIVYAEHLVGRSGHLVFTQRSTNIVYPSILGLAKNIIVLSSSTNIVPDLKVLLDCMATTVKVDNRPEENDLKFNLMDLISPLVLENDEEGTIANPRVTLILIEEK